MTIKMPFIEDPKTKEPSVSLSNLLLATVFLIVAGALHLAGKVEHTSMAVEYFGISSALYFGRKMNIGGKEYASEENKPDKE